MGPLISICGRCKRGRHEKCLDRGYWMTKPDERVGGASCACGCWAGSAWDEWGEPK